MRPIRWVRRGAALLGVSAAGGAAIVTTRYVLETPQPLESGLPGEGRIDREHGGELYYTVAGPEDARPIVLLHDFYPGASSYEYVGVYARLARSLRVYAPDWLGFGMSEHPPLAYTGEFYANTLAGYLRDVVAQPAIVVATGRAANVAVRAASDAPALFNRLVLVSPHVAAGMHLDPTLSQALVRLAQRISLGLVPYAVASSRPLLRWSANRRGLGAATEDVVDHEWAAAHQFGAQHAALAAVTGELDLPLQHVLPLLEPPVLLVAGAEDRRHPRDVLESFAVLNPHASLDVIPGAGAAVCQDQPGRFEAAVPQWIGRAVPRHLSSDTLRVGTQAALAAATAQRASSPTHPAPDATSALRAATAVGPTRGPRTAPVPPDATIGDDRGDIPVVTPTTKRPAVHKSASTGETPRARIAADAAATHTDEAAPRERAKANRSQETAEETTDATTDATTETGQNTRPGAMTSRRAPTPPRPRATSAPARSTTKPSPANGAGVAGKTRTRGAPQGRPAANTSQHKSGETRPRRSIRPSKTPEAEA